MYVRRSCGYRLTVDGIKDDITLYSMSALAAIVYGAICVGVVVMRVVGDFLRVMVNGSL